jgi:tRNA pseudouridine55 synthase
VKIRGERAYKRARRGEQLQMPERIVTVYSFEQDWREPDAAHPGLERAGYSIECGSGTYVRSLIADLGDAYCLELRRTAIGPFQVKDAVAPPERGIDWTGGACSGVAAAGTPPPPAPALLALERALSMLPPGRAE